MPVLARLQSEYADQGLQVLAVNIQSNYYPLDEWVGFMMQFAPNGLEKVIWDMAVQDVDNAAIKQYELTTLGTEVFLDPEGRVVGRSTVPLGYKSLRSEIESLLD